MSRLKFRRKENKYTQGTDNEFILSKKTLQSFTGYKDDKFKRIWNDLKVAGYLKQYKIRDKETGKFVYEYELLEEPNITTHHSLIVNENGSIVPNISKSKIEKIQNSVNHETKEIVNKLQKRENTPIITEGDFPHCGKPGVYYNNLLDKVCM